MRVPTDSVTWLEPNDQAAIVHRFFQSIITDLQTKTLAEILGHDDEGETDA